MNPAATLSPKQARSIVESRNAQINIWEGAVRSGKTMSSIVAFLDRVRTHCLTAPAEQRVVIIGRTMDTIYRNVISGIIELLGTDERDFKYTRGANVCWIFGREVDVIGANNVSAESRIRGMTIIVFYVDEGSLLPDLAYWEQLLNRQMTVIDPRGYVTTNPDNPTHWLKVDVIDRAVELGFNTWHFVMDDNPVLTAEAKAAATLRNRGLYYQRNILGLWVLAEGTIWDMWAEDRHVVTTLPELTHLTLVIDYGTAGVFAAGLLGVTASKQLRVAAEYRWDAKAEERQLTDAEYSKALWHWLDSLDVPGLTGIDDLDRVVVDPSATSFILQLHTDGWPRVRAANNAVADGIRSVASLLGADLLKAHESCSGLRKEVPGYVWDPKAALLGEDKPVKANDHSCDYLRYGVMALRRYWRPWLEAHNFTVTA